MDIIFDYILNDHIITGLGDICLVTAIYAMYLHVKVIKLGYTKENKS